MDEIVFADEEVDEINKYQRSGKYHPLTCGKWMRCAESNPGGTAHLYCVGEPTLEVMTIPDVEAGTHHGDPPRRVPGDDRKVIKMESEGKISIRPLPGSCCPEKDCTSGSWDGEHCRSCGADCSQCPLNGLPKGACCGLCIPSVTCPDNCPHKYSCFSAEEIREIKERLEVER